MSDSLVALPSLEGAEESKKDGTEGNRRGSLAHAAPVGVLHTRAPALLLVPPPPPFNMRVAIRSTGMLLSAGRV